MNSNRFLKAIVSILAVCLFCVSADAGDPTNRPLRAEIDVADARAITAAMAGTSIVLTYKDQWAGSAEEDEVAKNPPKLLRFPAGTHAMFFDWETGKYSGEGINPARKTSGYQVNSFFELAGRYGSEVSYIVNVFQDTPEKTGRLARYIHAKGFKVRYWELGNEPYADFYSDKFPNAGAYLAEARAHAEEIKKVFPAAEFGVAADPRLRHVNMWNAALAAQRDFSRIIVHKYFGPEKAKREEMIARSVQPDAFRAYSNMLKDSEPSEPNFTYIFPGKSFFVSEWGLLYIGLDLEDSLAHAIWMGRTFIKMSRAPSIHAAAYWNLNASPFELIQPLKQGGFIHRVPFLVYEMIGKQLAGAKRTMPVTLSSGGVVSSDVIAQMYDDAQGNSSMLMINSSPTAQTVEIPQALSGLTIVMISGDDILETNGYSKAFTPSVREISSERVVPVKITTAAKVFRLPGYSVASVYFKR